MIIARVTNRVVSNAKLSSIPARQLLEVVPEEGFGKPDPIVAIDTVEAGPGDRVLILQEGTGARQTVDYGDTPLPAQMMIVGIVDEVTRA